MKMNPPEFSQDSYGAKCHLAFYQVLDDNRGWVNPEDEFRFSPKNESGLYKRTIGLTTEDSYQEVSQYAKLEGKLFNRQLRHKMFEVAMLGAAAQNGLRQQEHWFVVQSNPDEEEQLLHFSNRVKSNPKLEEVRGRYAYNLNRSIYEGSLTATEDNLERLHSVLGQISLGGLQKVDFR